MTIRIDRDPNNPLGGYAVLRVVDVSSDKRELSLRLQRQEDEKLLAADGWGPGSNARSIGPLPLEIDGSDLLLRLGPDVVNHMEPFQKLTVAIPELGLTESLQWPADIQKKRAPKITRGGVSSTTRTGSIGRTVSRAQSSPASVEAPVEPAKSAPQSSAVEPKPEERVEAEHSAEDIDQKSGAVAKSSTRRGAVIAVVVLLIVLFIAFVVWKWFASTSPEIVEQVPQPETKSESTAVSHPDPDPASNPETPVKVAAEPATDICDAPAVQGADADNRWLMAKSCLNNDDEQTALRLIERLAAENYGPARLQLGVWLDPGETGATPLGPRNANTAMRHYASARDAGLDEAESRITRLCATLADDSTLTARMTTKKYCEGN